MNIRDYWIEKLPTIRKQSPSTGKLVESLLINDSKVARETLVEMAKMKMKVYDKVSWHYPEGNSSNLNSAKNHFSVIMNWLNKNNLLTKEGKEVYSNGIDSNFSITSVMINSKGNELLRKYYSKWIKNIDGKTKNEMLSIWENLVSNKKKTTESKEYKTDIFNEISKKYKIYNTKPASEDEIKEAETKLTRKFPEEYKKYLLKFGDVSFSDTELTGLNVNKNANVVDVTLKEIKLNKNFPKDCIVLENLGIEGILILIDSKGTVYEFRHDTKKKIYNSMEEYLKSKINGE